MKSLNRPTQGWWWLSLIVLLVASVLRVNAFLIQVEDIPSSSPVPMASIPPAVDMQALATLKLFQQSSLTFKDNHFRVSVMKPDSPRLRDAPLTTLNARLTGVISGPEGIAIVEQEKTQRSYQPGEKLSAEASVVSIFNDRVIINHRGQYEALHLN
ncbi:type II secretion system protein N [Enterobacter cloacae]|uniref:type II secretion system protein N n=1 Tax=Enterobacter cloacae TaxID=550 RepID=UPI00101AF1A7|nr:type II secretion system protein N [Enterobacter cloacae]QBC03369.1 hypothetical protein EWI30_15315 [Enterobacter cloacae]